MRVKLLLVISALTLAVVHAWAVPVKVVAKYASSGLDKMPTQLSLKSDNTYSLAFMGVTYEGTYIRRNKKTLSFLVKKINGQDAKKMVGKKIVVEPVKGRKATTTISNDTIAPFTLEEVSTSVLQTKPKDPTEPVWMHLERVS